MTHSVCSITLILLTFGPIWGEGGCDRNQGVFLLPGLNLAGAREEGVSCAARLSPGLSQS